MQRVISHRLSLVVLVIYAPEKMSSRTLNFLFFKGNIIWTCAVGPSMSPTVEFISFAKTVIENTFLIEKIKVTVFV